MTDTQKQTKILIVEDEVLVAKDLESRIKGLGYNVCGKATTAEKALDLVKHHQPDLVMMDIVLKGEMDGIEAADHIRSTKGIPIIFITAYAAQETLERAKLAMPFGYILSRFKKEN